MRLKAIHFCGAGRKGGVLCCLMLVFLAFVLFPQVLSLVKRYVRISRFEGAVHNYVRKYRERRDIHPKALMHSPFSNRKVWRLDAVRIKAMALCREILFVAYRQVCPKTSNAKRDLIFFCECTYVLAMAKTSQSAKEATLRRNIRKRQNGQNK